MKSNGNVNVKGAVTVTSASPVASFCGLTVIADAHLVPDPEVIARAVAAAGVACTTRSEVCVEDGSTPSYYDDAFYCLPHWRWLATRLRRSVRTSDFSW